jgi:hypothetical protein
MRSLMYDTVPRPVDALCAPSATFIYVPLTSYKISFSNNNR